MKRILLPAFALVSLLATASLSSAQSPTPTVSPTPSASSAKHAKKKKASAAPAADSAMTPAASPSDTAAPTAKKHAPPKPLESPAPGGGPGMVWVNNKSKAYHMPSSRWYGRTKDGKYMTEEAAKAEGDHAAPGKD